jgi:hypothetical protein
VPLSSLSRNNRDKSLPKGGSGRYNWGSIEDEPELEAGAEYDEVLEIEEEPQAQNRWTGGAEPAPVNGEQQRTSRVTTPGDIDGVLYCNYPDVFVVALANIAMTFKAAQRGKTQAADVHKWCDRSQGSL